MPGKGGNRALAAGILAKGKTRQLSEPADHSTIKVFTVPFVVGFVKLLLEVLEHEKRFFYVNKLMHSTRLNHLLEMPTGNAGGAAVQ